MALTFNHQTPEAFISRLREAYRNGDREQTVKLSKFITARIQSGDFTDAQFRTAFGMTAAKWNTLKTKMNDFATAERKIKSAVGE